MAEWAARDPRILYVRQPRNLGLAGNVRHGIALAKAELVAVLYDGDVYDPRLLERWVAALSACPEAAFVFNAYNRLGADGRIEVTYREHLDSCVPGRVLLERLYFRRWHFASPVWGTVMLRRSKYLAAGGLDTRFSFVADVDLYLRLAETNCVAYVPEPLIGLASRETVPKLFRHPQAIGPSSLPRSEDAPLPGSSAPTAGRNASTLDVRRHGRRCRPDAGPGRPVPSAAYPATITAVVGQPRRHDLANDDGAR